MTELGAPRKWTYDQLREAAPVARSMADLMKRLGVALGGGSYRCVRGHLDRLGIDTPMMDGSINGDYARLTDEEYLKKHLVISTCRVGVRLRNRLFSAGWFEKKCYRCGITTWQGEEAPLQLEHKNGNPYDNRIENLTILCANCHLLTPTWGRKTRSSVVLY